MMEREKKLYLSMAEASEELKLPKYVIRFWEGKFHQISPMKRAGGRRFFGTEDVLVLRLIKHLLYDKGLTIRGTQNLLKKQSVKSLAKDMENGAIEERIVSQSQEKDEVASIRPSASAKRVLNDLLQELKSIRQLAN